MSNEFQPGDEVFLESGSRVRIAAIGVSEFFVNESDESFDDEGLESHFSDDVIRVTRVFEGPPVQAKDNQLETPQPAPAA